jgi:hypothetical protein
MDAGTTTSDEDDQAARDHRAQGPHNGSGDRRRRADPPATAITLYVVVTPELLADHEVSGAALAEWTEYAVPTPEKVGSGWAQFCYTANQIRNYGKERSNA